MRTLNHQQQYTSYEQQQQEITTRMNQQQDVSIKDH